ncbi:hypothetical protein FACS1894217_13580 [Clostridia bacterium]|nr:hypothetical protein FACS1894217_13580 [Clostridia bacterium]
MNRTQAREYAVQIVYSLGVSDFAEPADTLDDRLSEETIARLRGEDELYDKPPQGLQAEYIRRLVDDGTFDVIALMGS